MDPRLSFFTRHPLALYSLINDAYLEYPLIEFTCSSRDTIVPISNNETRLLTTSFGKVSLSQANVASPITLLFLHGHCTNKTFFHQQMNAPIFTAYRRIALDLPGYGESPPPFNIQHSYNFPGFAEVVAEVVEQLSINQLIIVGWSLGGHVALELIPRLEQLLGLVITGTPPIEVSGIGLTQGFKVLAPEILQCFGKKDLTLKEAQLLAQVSGYDYSQEKQFLVDAILHTDNDVRFLYPQSITEEIGLNQKKIVATWEKPIAVIAGEQDIAINYHYVKGLDFKNLWQQKIHFISNAGHAVILEQPDAFNDLVSQFIVDLDIFNN